MNGKLIILTGFSGSGKDTLMNMILEKRTDISRIVTHTTRPKRTGEVHGVDYYFVQEHEFEQMIAKDEFFEYVKYGSHYKGTHKSQLTKTIGESNFIWRIDMTRAAVIENDITEKFGEKTANLILAKTVKILIKSPSSRSALARYKARENNTFDSDEFIKRLQIDTEVWKTHRHKFPHVVINKTNKQSEALNEILDIIDNS